ncbi:MAG TPA: phosphotransferase [Glycomyces sp.]|nr:phosphotransferase [Glycomyces sp.]
MGEFGFDESSVRSLLEEQHPDLAGLALRRVEGGWDNRMWRLGEDLAVRLPRTPRAPALLRKEHRWLPRIAPRLPLPVPVPVRAGAPSDRFPHFWTVTTWVAGEPADRAPIARAHAAEALAAFLKALHRPAPAGAPADPHRGAPLGALAEEADRRFRAMAESGEDTAALEAVWNDALAAPEWDGPPLWLHGDLHPANVVVEDGTLAGVIDFGDLCSGDPAADLAAAWLLLPAGAARRCFDAYAGADEAAIRRARGAALLKSLVLIEIGRAGDLGLTGGKPTWGPAGRAALERLLAFDPASR